MRILFISNLYPPHELGGWEQNCREVVERLQARGHVCHVLASSFGVQGQPVSEECVTRGLYLEANVYHYHPLDFFLKRPWQERSNRRVLRWALDTFQPDVISVWGMWNLSRCIAYWAEQWLPGRVAYSIASYRLIESDAHHSFWQSPANRLWAEKVKVPVRYIALSILAREKQSYSLELRHVACVSEYVRGRLAKAGVLPHGAKVIYNGIDPEPFVKAAHRRPQDGVLRLIYTGGLNAHKGVQTAIEALGLLRRRGKIEGIRLNLVGGGHPQYIKKMKQRIHELGISEFVKFHGRVPREQIPNLLERADVFLFTSVWEEPIARSVMEAMAAKLAVIGTAVGGQREMLEEGVNALIFPPDNAEKLAEHILRLKLNPRLARRLAEAGQKMVLERFTLTRMVDQIEEFLRDVIESADRHAQ